ncbi:MAG: hypothetical protein HN742_07035 [Lentisphaerae bacterium]|jgi:acyl-CoA thioesterase I|nr:hypothetical protein [Lentisphaerota bacterium]MBT4816113.1 hypothetical protein [Lentisphaerota bacterium]MBT5608637.1 hypothetical protein [Lentisphaerota bacterium]MBT7057946.1 hypothetical protein [Lentisphaerota bacterium]MBT7841607.1 hypothetical protein [Lentisphaerota bacterium]
MVNAQLLSLVPIAILLAGNSRTEGAGEAQPVKKRRYIQAVAFGDSLTWSMRAPYGERYADHIEAELAERLGPDICVDVAACGAGGNTAREALPRVQRDLIDYAPDLVILNLGANDSGREKKEVFERSYRAILERLRTETDALVVCETIPVLDEEWHLYRDRGFARKAGGLNRYLEAFSHSFIRRVAKEHSSLVHDRFSIYHDALREAPSLRSRLIRRDGVHLTEEGNAYFAKTLADLVRDRVLERQRREPANSEEWLGRAEKNATLQRVLAASSSGPALRAALLKNEHVVRLELQQARSHARRAACSNAPDLRTTAARIEALAAAFMATQRMLNPATANAGAGSRKWALERLQGLSDVPGGLRQLLE